MKNLPSLPLPRLLEILRCPDCQGALQPAGDKVECSACSRHFPLVDNIPILILEDRSFFRHSDFTQRKDTFFKSQGGLRRFLFSIMPSMSVNMAARGNYARMARLLPANGRRPRILIVGGSILGAGMEDFRSNPDYDFVDTDVSLGPLTAAVCDAHDLPLADGSVDAVILQAVLEHVSDPYRVVSETLRVLKPDGIVYAETPFLEPAHATPYDFQRFTFIGYRKLFRDFEEISLGPVGGPGQALGSQYEHAMLCLSTSRAVRGMIYMFVRWTGWWLKYLDWYLNRNPYAVHCAYGLYFLGKRSSRRLNDEEVIQECRKFC